MKNVPFICLLEPDFGKYEFNPYKDSYYNLLSDFERFCESVAKGYVKVGFVVRVREEIETLGYVENSLRKRHVPLPEGRNVINIFNTILDIVDEYSSKKRISDDIKVEVYIVLP